MYYCCNVYGDFYDLYFDEYIPRDKNECVYLFGMCVFNHPNWQKETVDYIKNLIPYKCELHGISPKFVNVGIWTDEKLPKDYEVLK